ncbi:MAG: TolC family protein [Rikenellaceae bacterium]|nr:TolC family protein [Rikenellaceae bacterium]
MKASNKIILTVFIALPLFWQTGMASTPKVRPGILEEAEWGPVPTFGATPVAVTFDQYIEMVMLRNHGMAAEMMRNPIARAEIEAAKVLPDPELAFEGADDLYSIELGYTIEFGRKRGARINYARTFAQMEKFEVEIFAAELRLTAAEAYIEALAQREMLEVARSSYDYMIQLSRSDSLRHLAGEITLNEARQSSLEAKTLLGEVYRQEGTYLASLAVLGYFTGISADTLLLPAGEVETHIAESPLPALIGIGLQNRIENELAIHSVELARRELALAKSERKPDVDVFIGYERDWKGFYRSREMLKGGVTIPLKFSAINKGSVRAAKFAVEQERRQEMNVQAGIETEIVQAYHLYHASLNNYEHYLSGIMDQARQVLDGIVYSYMAGETDVLEVLVAQRTYNETREQFIESKKDVQTAAVNLLYACGHL